jgi:hypothetical protein
MAPTGDSFYHDLSPEFTSISRRICGSVTKPLLGANCTFPRVEKVGCRSQKQVFFRSFAGIMSALHGNVSSAARAPAARLRESIDITAIA